MGFGVVGLDFQRLLVMGDGHVNLSAASQGVAEVVVGLGVVGIDFQRLLVMGDGQSTCPRPARALPRLLWATLFCEVQARAWVQRVSLSCHNDV